MQDRFRRWFLAASLGAALAFSAVAFVPAASAQANAASSSIPLSVPIGDKTSVSGLPEYVVTVYRYMLGVVTVLAIIMVIYGGFRYLLGATTGDVKSGQTIIKDVIGGMAILFLAYVILYNINPKTVNLSLPAIDRIRSVGLTGAAGSQTESAGMSCVRDNDCQAGSKCLRLAGGGGICADGVQGSMCKCEGTGCDVTAEQAGGPVNNGGTGRIACQSGLVCDQVSNGHWACNGGAVGSACNESSDYAVRINNVQALRNGASIAASLAETAVAFGTLGAIGDASNPFNDLPDATKREIREALRCHQPGQYCFQTTASQAGACVYGDPRDLAMFNAIPEYRQNAGLQEAVSRCDLTMAQLRELPKARGGCKNVTNENVDEFCIQHRYHCANAAVCGMSEYGPQFDTTIAQYHSIENVPNQLKPSWYFKQGCYKPVGSACQSDGECASKCLGGRCSGFGTLAIASSVRPGTLRTNELPTRVDQLEYRSRGSDCADATWTAIDLLYDEPVRALNDPTLDRNIINLLFQAGTYERFACYPKRAAGAKCDFSAQCVSGTCVQPTGGSGSSLPATFSHPTDNAVGAGTCS